jgi:hypothetical protein
MVADLSKREKVIGTVVKEGIFRNVAERHQTNFVIAHFKFCLNLLEADSVADVLESLKPREESVMCQKPCKMPDDDLEQSLN